MTATEDLWNWIYPAILELKNTADQPWAERRSHFLEQLGIHESDGHPVTDELLRHLDELPDDERSTLVESDQLDTLAYELIQTQDTESDEPAAAGGEYDEAAWQTYLTANGSYWNGETDSWPAFREWFIYHAGDQGLSTPANALLDYLEGMPVAERITALAQYGVTIAVGQAPSDTEEAGDLDKMLDELAAMTEDIEGIEDMSDEEIAQIIRETIGQTGK